VIFSYIKNKYYSSILIYKKGLPLMPVTPLSDKTLSAFDAYPTVNQQRLSSSKHEPCSGSCNNDESKTTTVEKHATPMTVSLMRVDATSHIIKSNTFHSIASYEGGTSREHTSEELTKLILDTIKSAAEHGQLTSAASISLTSLLEKLNSNPAYAALRPHHQPQNHPPQTLFHNNAQPKKSSHASKSDTNNPANDQKPTAK
jgi:hypothetical protein